MRFQVDLVNDWVAGQTLAMRSEYHIQFTKLVTSNYTKLQGVQRDLFLRPQVNIIHYEMRFRDYLRLIKNETSLEDFRNKARGSAIGA